MTISAVRIGLIGAGRIGANHARILAEHTPGAQLVAIADPNPEAANRIAEQHDIIAVSGAAELFDQEIDAVVIAAPSVLHSDLICAAAEARLAVFSEKPAGMTLEEIDRAIEATRAADLPFQVGFNRRFAPGFAQTRASIDRGELGSVQLLRSNTRDPQLSNPGAIAPWTIFTQTLIHDFDTLNWLNPGAKAVRVYAQAGALIAPDFADQGLLDTALVTITYSNGALAVADASFQAVYGYDVRAEVFGSGGLATMGHARSSDQTYYGSDGIRIDTSRSDTELLQESYRAEFASFVAAVRSGVVTASDGAAARAAFEIAQASIDSIINGTPIDL